MNDLNIYLKNLEDIALKNISDSIEISYIDAKTRLSLNKIETDKGKIIYSNELNNQLFENYLKSKGYVLNTVLGEPIFIKSFVCVKIHKHHLEVWIDKIKSKPVLIKDSFLTGLPITLNYMERI